MGGCCCCFGNGDVPPGFPSHVEASYQKYANWSKDPNFVVDALLIATPKNVDEIMAIVDWATKNGYRVRPTGQRHNWSPLTIGPKTPSKDKVVIVDMRKHMNKLIRFDSRNKQITCEPGMMLGDFLELCSRGGVSVPHTPAPYDITMGGVLSINGHGTAVPTPDELKRGEDNCGSLSNRLVALTIIAWDDQARKYVVRKVSRTDPEFPALQCAVGRTYILDFTMQCVDDYFMRCRSTFDLTWQELFPAPTGPATGAPGARFPAKSMAHFVDKFGRAEVIWFPYTEKPWLKVWNKVRMSGPGVDYSNLVELPGPFTFTDNIPKFATVLINSALGNDNDPAHFEIFKEEKSKFVSAMRKDTCGCILGACKDCFCRTKAPASFPSEDDRDLYGDDTTSVRELLADAVTMIASAGRDGWGKPQLTDDFGKLQKSISEFGLQSTDTWDIWGKSKNTLIYVRTSTARVTANGYIVIMARKDLQLGMWMFVDLFKRLETKYMAERKYPANMPLEIRVTGLDHGGPVGNARAPYMSGCTSDGVPSHLDVCLWLDNLSFPETPSANEFYEEMEREIVKMYSDKSRIEAIVRPEWSKGWGYTAQQGPFTSDWFRDHTRQGLPNWNNAIAILDRLDPNHMFSNPYWDKFMCPIALRPSQFAQPAQYAAPPGHSFAAAPPAFAPQSTNEPFAMHRQHSPPAALPKRDSFDSDTSL